MKNNDHIWFDIKGDNHVIDMKLKKNPQFKN